MARQHHRPTPKSQQKRKRRRAAQLAVAARWKHHTSSTALQSSSSSTHAAASSSPQSVAPVHDVVGSRVMDINCLSKGLTKASEHAKQCSGHCFINNEFHREGLASVLEVSCDGCEDTFFIESSDKMGN